MSDSFYPPLEVYKKLPTIMGYRKLELVNGNYTNKTTKKTKQSKETGQSKVKVSKDAVVPWLSPEKFMELIQWERFCIVEARDSPTKDRRHPKTSAHAQSLKVKTFFIILDKDYETNSADIAKIMNRLPDIESSTHKINIDCIVISEDYLSIFSKKKLDQYAADGLDKPNPDKPDEPYKSGYVMVTNQLHSLFMHDLFARPTQPKFRIVPRDEEERIIQEILINKANLEKKSSNDPEMVILGAVSGDFIEIIASHENTGQMIRYGLVR